MSNTIPIDKDSGYPVCVNPSCKAEGKSHPHCRCWGLARGGIVPGHYCSEDRKHEDGCLYYKDEGPVPPSLYSNGGYVSPSPQETVDHYVAGHGLLNLLTKAGKQEDYLDKSQKGKNKLTSHLKNLVGPDKMDLEQDKDSTAALKKHLEVLEEDPSQLLDLGGPADHASQIGATAASAIGYLNGLKPKKQQLAPLDPPSLPDKLEKDSYDRQVAIAQNPLLVMRHIKDGRLHPSDLITLHTLYPQLGQSLVNKVGEALITAKSKELPISNRQRHSLGLLLNQPMDYTQTPAAMQAIIASSAAQQAERQSDQPKKGNKGGSTTSAQLRQIDKVDKLSQTPLEARLINRNSK